MLREIYLLLKQHLTANVERLEHVDYYLNQFTQVQEDAVYIVPGCYIRFLPLTWRSMGDGIQRADQDLFEIHVISETAYGDERDITDIQYIDHLGLERDIYVALHRRSFNLNQLPGVETDCLLLQNLERTRSQPHEELNNLITTVLTFKGTAYDVSAAPSMQQVLAEICVEVDIEIKTD